MPIKSEQEVRRGLPALLPRMWRFALVLSSSRDLADDLTQSSAERALTKASQFQVGTGLDTWVFSIVSSVWKNQRRSDNVRRGQGVQSIDDIELEAGGNSSETNVLGDQVLKLVMKLPTDQKDAIFLVYVEGYSYKEAARILDIPIGTVMSRLATGRKKINEAVNKGTVSIVKKEGQV